MTGEIHEEMNQQLRLKEQDIKLKKSKLMEILKLIKESTNNLKENKIYSSRLDVEILLSYV